MKISVLLCYFVTLAYSYRYNSKLCINMFRRFLLLFIDFVAFFLFCVSVIIINFENFMCRCNYAYWACFFLYLLQWKLIHSVSIYLIILQCSFLYFFLTLIWHYILSTKQPLRHELKGPKKLTQTSKRLNKSCSYFTRFLLILVNYCYLEPKF